MNYRGMSDDFDELRPDELPPVSPGEHNRVFPFIDQLGLEVKSVLSIDGSIKYQCDAEALEALLAKAPVVDAHVSTSGTGNAGAPTWIARPWQDADSTHTALLIGIEPIRKETKEMAEDLLREWLALRDGEGSQYLGLKASLEFAQKCDDHEKRVRKLVGK